MTICYEYQKRIWKDGGHDFSGPYYYGMLQSQNPHTTHPYPEETLKKVAGNLLNSATEIIKGARIKGFRQDLKFSVSCITEDGHPSIRCFNFQSTNAYHSGPDFTEEDLASFSISTLPGNKKLLVSHDSFVNYGYRGKGLATSLHSLKNQIVNYYSQTELSSCSGSATLLCTVNAENAAERRVMAKTGFKVSGELYPGCLLYTKE